MSDGYFISMEGIRSAEQLFNQAARRIGEGRPAMQPAQSPAPSDLVRLSSVGPVTASPSLAPVDYAAEMLTIIEAKIGFETSLKVTAVQQKLDRNMLDLLA